MATLTAVILFINSALLVYGIYLLRSALPDLKARADLTNKRWTDIRSKVLYSHQYAKSTFSVVSEIREEISKIAPKRRTTT